MFLSTSLNVAAVLDWRRLQKFKKGVLVGFCGIGLASQVLHEIKSFGALTLAAACRAPGIASSCDIDSACHCLCCSLAVCAGRGSILATGIIGNLWTFVVATLLA